MALPVLPAHFTCRCGAVHTCPIEKVVSGEDVLKQVPVLLDGMKHVVLVSDGNTAPLAADRLTALLKGSGIAVAEAFFNTTAVVVPDETSVAFIQRFITPDTEALVGVGSGVINDLCKYVSYEAELPYMMVATAPSMDGYASKGAAMVLDGMKVTTNARPPRWIVGDWNLLASAPLSMLQSGIGDLLGKYSCLNDWRCAALLLDEPFCQEIYRDVKVCAEAAAADIEAVLRRDKTAVGRLFEGLVQVGIAMSFAGNSRPASGSEHHLAHFYEIVGLQRGFAYLAHGIDVAYGTLLTCELREQLAVALEQMAEKPVEAPLLEQKLPAWQQIFGNMACEVETLQRKVGYYDTKKRAERQQKIWENRRQLAAILQDAPSAVQMEAMLTRTGLLLKRYTDTYGKNGADVIEQSMLWAKDLKDRYTLFNLLEDVGMLSSAVGAVAERIG